jgi:hypothetical protein
MSVPPPNQCFADGSEGADPTAEASVGPPPPPSLEPTLVFDGPVGAEGGDSAGSDALVRRFSGEGAGGAPATLGALSASEDTCVPDDLKAMGSCGATVLAAMATGGLGAIFAGLSCAGAALAVVNCHSKSEGVSGR